MRCYAETLNKRLGTGFAFSPEFTDKVEFRLNESELVAILKMKKPSMIFLGDMLDLHASFVPEDLLRPIYNTMVAAKQHIFQLSTKRAGNMAAFVDEHYPQGLPEHIWCATSCGSWMYKSRLDELRKVKTEIRFVNFEPLIDSLKPPVDLSGISQVIVGGESGHNHRPMNPSWAWEVYREARRQKVAFYYKQSSNDYPGRGTRLFGKTYHEFPIDVSHWRRGW